MSQFGPNIKNLLSGGRIIIPPGEPTHQQRMVLVNVIKSIAETAAFFLSGPLDVDAKKYKELVEESKALMESNDCQTLEQCKKWFKEQMEKALKMMEEDEAKKLELKRKELFESQSLEDGREELES